MHEDSEDEDMRFEGLGWVFLTKTSDPEGAV